MSLYCTNIDVYFDNEGVYNSRCVKGCEMHNGKSDLREWAVSILVVLPEF